MALLPVILETFRDLVLLRPVMEVEERTILLQHSLHAARGVFETVQAGVYYLLTDLNCQVACGADCMGRASSFRPKPFRPRHFLQCGDMPAGVLGDISAAFPSHYNSEKLRKCCEKVCIHRVASTFGVAVPFTDSVSADATLADCVCVAHTQ